MHRRHDPRARPDCPLRAAGLFVLTLLNSACGAGWHLPEPPPSGALPPRPQVQVWQGAEPGSGTPCGWVRTPSAGSPFWPRRAATAAG